jgi:hypothetical protein
VSAVEGGEFDRIERTTGRTRLRSLELVGSTKGLLKCFELSLQLLMFCLRAVRCEAVRYLRDDLSNGDKVANGEPERHVKQGRDELAW